MIIELFKLLDIMKLGKIFALNQRVHGSSPCGDTTKKHLFFQVLFLYIYFMSTITLQLPDTLELSPRDTVRFLAAKLYESSRLSLGQAAELAGLSKATFAEILADYGVSLVNYSIDDVINDAANI